MIVLVSDPVVTNTGFGIVSKYLAMNLFSLGLKVVNLNFAIPGSFKWNEILIEPYLNIKSIMKYNPEYVIFYGCPFMFPFKSILDDKDFELLKKRSKIIIYGIHDCIDLSPSNNDYFTRGHIVAMPTENHLKTLDMIPNSRLEVLTHGFNTDLYYETKPEYDFGIIAQNMPRKRFDLFLKLLAITRKSGYMKTTKNGYWNIEAIGLYWVKYYTTFLKYHIDENVYNEDEAVKMHNFKVNYHVTEGEAFALPVAQSLLCGQPSFVIEHPALKEVYGDSVYYIKGEEVLRPDGNTYLNPIIEFTKAEEVLEHYNEYKEKLLSRRDEFVKKFDYRYNEQKSQIKHILDKVEKFDRTIKDIYFYPKVY